MMPPIPTGWYYITERRLGEQKSKNSIQKNWRWLWGVYNDKEKWFSLINAQTQSNTMLVNGMSQGDFKFHPLNPDGSEHSTGCVTFYNDHEFMILRGRMLKKQ